ncbi:MAG TPA: glycoside hydrolase family 3 N-terminal domain-containing protein [Dissulfurispiraceae bacterium]|nr:glycoside hydrolase family 3 N-terminal domain-containing protein [Dissulfurispiraceae bacterium]
MHELTREAKLYQLIIDRIDGDRLNDADYRKSRLALVDRGIGGFILFGGNRADVAAFVAEAQQCAKIALFIASDIERGTAQQIRGGTEFPTQMAVAAALDLRRHEDRYQLAEALKLLAREAAEIGINMPLLPVLDVNLNADNPIICTRAFSDDPQTVSDFGALYIKMLQSCALIACAKHFPGHGDTITDSHLELPAIRKEKQELMDCELKPFRDAISAGVKSIMVGHLLIPALSDKPASVSGEIVTDLLRRELGYEGLIMTDALTMQALAGIEDLPAACMKAGMDILLHPADAGKAVGEIAAALDRNELSESRIDDAVARIIHTKQTLRGDILPEASGHLGATAARLAGRALTLINLKNRVLPLDDPEKVVLIVCGETARHDASPISTAFPNHASLESPNIPDDAVVLFAVFTSVAAWHGSSGIAPEERALMLQAIQRAHRSIVISFGSPYILRFFDSADALIAAYDSSRFAQGAAIGCLTGAFGFRGTLPVRMLDGDTRGH